MLALLLLVPRAGRGQPSDPSTPSRTDPASSTTETDGTNTDGSTPPGSRQTHAVLWIFQKSGVEADSVEAFRKGLQEALASSERTHLLTRRAFREYLERRGADVPPCFKGLASCNSPRAVVYEQLDLGLAVQLTLETEDDRFLASYEARDRRGQVNRSADIAEASPRRAAFALVRDLFDAAGRVSLQSTPSGANVRVDGDAVGTTPVELELPVGEHAYTLQHDHYQTIEGTFELTSAGSRVVRETLRQKPGTLRVEGAPEGAVVHLQDRRLGAAGDPLELEPGSYTVEVRADGYVPFRDSVQIEPGQTVERNVSLKPRNILLRDVAAEDIAVNHYIARLAFTQSIHPTTFRDARAWADGKTYEFQNFTTESGARSSDLVLSTLAPSGLRLDVAYTRRRLGLTVLSLSYLAARVQRRAVLETRDDTTIEATASTLHRLQIRPFQLSYRYLFGNIAPFAELGMGLTFHWLRADGPSLAVPLSVSQTTSFWTLGLGAQYFFKPRWFLQLRYDLQDYFTFGPGVEHALSFGAGIALPNLFGFEPEPPEEL